MTGRRRRGSPPVRRGLRGHWPQADLGGRGVSNLERMKKKAQLLQRWRWGWLKSRQQIFHQRCSRFGFLSAPRPSPAPARRALLHASSAGPGHSCAQTRMLLPASEWRMDDLITPGAGGYNSCLCAQGSRPAPGLRTTASGATGGRLLLSERGDCLRWQLETHRLHLCWISSFRPRRMRAGAPPPSGTE